MSASHGGPDTLFQVRPELYSPARFPPKVYELHRTRAVVTDVIAQQCWLMLLAIAHVHRRSQSTHGLPRVGIIGGGHMGCAIAIALLDNSYPADLIAISTRQPDKVPKCSAIATPAQASQFEQITRFYDNARLSKESSVLFLCMPPSQLKSVAIQIKHALGVAHSPCVLISVLCATPTEILQKACGTKLVLRSSVRVEDLKERWSGSDTKPVDGCIEAKPQLDEDTLAMALDQLKVSPTTAAVGASSNSMLSSVLQELTRRLDHSSIRAAPEISAHTGDDPKPPSDKTAIDDGAGTAEAAAATTADSATTAVAWPMAWTRKMEQLQLDLLGPEEMVITSASG